MVLFSNFTDVALTKYMNFLTAVRAERIAHIFHETKNRNVHKRSHFHCFTDNHGNQILWTCNNDNAINRNVLEYGKCNITGSRRHIDKQIIDIIPKGVRPELANRSANHRTTPYNRVTFIFQKDINGHNIHAVFF